jgi:hypothetical protein
MCYPLLVGKKLIISDPVSGCINVVNDSGHIFNYLEGVEGEQTNADRKERKRPSGEPRGLTRWWWRRRPRANLKRFFFKHGQSHKQTTPTMAARVVKLIPSRTVFLFCDIQLKFSAHAALV